ncbi:MAG: pyrroline-5-carboxylate reductase [Cetobacterium sp.]|uniref:pyrroline-5-carboxylate reductase n=1 Tax=Cetobacterium sp. TaxID=2071632 RepID=UPI003F3213E0
MNKIIGFIGAGNMGTAMAGGMIKSGVIKKENIIFSDVNEKSLEKVKNNLGVEITTDNIEVGSKADIIILAVKPNLYKKVIDEINDSIKDSAIIISIAAGITVLNIENYFGREIKLARTMPNTPALVNEGMTALMPNNKLSSEEIEEIKMLLGTFGKVEIVEEKMIDSVIAVSGSSPAYVFMLIEAMGDAGVLEGMPRDKAYAMAAQAVLGAAKMVLETGIHPGQLKDMVCSPGGTTIEAVAKLEEKGFKSAVIEAMRVCADKSKKM